MNSRQRLLDDLRTFVQLASVSGRRVLTVKESMLGLDPAASSDLGIEVVTEDAALRSAETNEEIVILGHSILGGDDFPSQAEARRLGEGGTICARVSRFRLPTEEVERHHGKEVVGASLAVQGDRCVIYSGIEIPEPGWATGSISSASPASAARRPWLPIGATAAERALESAWRQDNLYWYRDRVRDVVVELPDRTLGHVAPDGRRTTHPTINTLLREHLPRAGYVEFSPYFDSEILFANIRTWAQETGVDHGFLFQVGDKHVAIAQIDGTAYLVPSCLEGAVHHNQFDDLIDDGTIQVVWEFDARWNTGAPVSWEYHETLLRFEHLYYFLQGREDGRTIRRLGVFTLESEARLAASRFSEADHYRELEAAYPDDDFD